MCSTRDFLEVFVPFFLLFTYLSAIPADSCSGLFVDAETKEGHGQAAGSAPL